MIKQSIWIVVISTVIALAGNLFSPNKIPVFGNYRSLHTGDGPIVPPEAAAGDPMFIAIDVAELDYSGGKAIFVDAREPFDFECGTIPGSVNIPFDNLPEGDLCVYFRSELGEAPLDTRIITYCSGEECDLSLHLARNMQACGYTNVAIFFGGSREWERTGLEIERRRQCGE